MRVLLFALCTLMFTSCSVSFHTTRRYDETYKNPFEISRIDTIPGSKADLHTKANIWLATTFKSAKSVIQMNDKEAGIIIAKCSIVSKSAEGNNFNGLKTYNTDYIDYTISIFVKQDRVHIVFSDFYCNGHSLNEEKASASIDADRWANIRGDSYEEAMTLRKDFKRFMKTDPFNW